MNEAHENYRQYLEGLSLDTLNDLSLYVTQDVCFKDPFNNVRGVDAMERIFHHMFNNMQTVKFRVHKIASEGQVCFMSWRFEGKLRGKGWAFDGASVMRFADDGRVAEHTDYWDVGRDFYEHFPIIGTLIAFLRRRLSA
tara:strand:- start:6062 stop:6478 length:417 start_codon:yes stop_codon:yes gene_type:complete